MDQSDLIISKLAEIVGATHVSSAPADIDAYGGLEPLAVVWPGAAAEVARILKTCGELDVAVGVSACGTRTTHFWPLRDNRKRVALDTRRMMNILEVDELSLTVHSQCGIPLAHLEEALNRQSLTLGPFPPTILKHTLGGLIAAPHPEAHSPQCGWLMDACIALSVAHADGTVLHTRVAPRRATGPDVSRLYIGSRSAMGVLNTAFLRVQRLPEHVQALGFVFPTVERAVGAARRALARGIRPARLKVLNTRRAVNELGPAMEKCRAVVLTALTGPAPLVEAQRNVLQHVVAAAEGAALPHSVSERWWARNTRPVEMNEDSTRHIGARLNYGQFADAFSSIITRLGENDISIWAEQFSDQSVTLWFDAEEQKRDETEIRSIVLDAGVDPYRVNFPPLFVELRHKLDPTETLVVMEA